MKPFTSWRLGVCFKGRSGTYKSGMNINERETHVYRSFSEIAISKQILFSIAFPLVAHTVPDCVLGITAGGGAGYMV